MDDEAIRTIVARLARPHPSGGRVIERAAILAEGSASSSILSWITEHGEPEDLTPVGAGRGLHSARDDARADPRSPLRYVLPDGALS